MKILIDNGHVADTPGKRTDGKLREYAWNRLIVGRIVAALSDLGHDAQLFVPEQEDISLSERCRRVNAICQALGISSIPTLFFFKPNAQPGKMVGAPSEAELEKIIQDFIK